MYDEGYRRWRASAKHLALFSDGLPAEIQPFSFVPLDGMEFLSAELALPRGGTLADFGCGRGGPGMWLAARAGAAVIGIDSSQVAVEDAASRQKSFPGLVSGRFVVADVAGTGLSSGCADAVVSIDVLQLVPDPAAMVREMARVVKPGGRVVVTTWEGSVFPPDVASMFAELVDVEVLDRAEWLPRQWAIYDAAIETDDGSDPAITDLAKEAAKSLPWRTDIRRVVVTASRS